MTATFQPLLDALHPDAIVYVPGATGESPALFKALSANRDSCRGVHFVSCLLPGINSTDYAALSEGVLLTTFLLPPALRASFETGRVCVAPLCYSGIAQYLSRDLVADIAVVHVSIPDAAGRCSFGIAADFGPLVWGKAKKRVLLVNRAMPQIARSPHVKIEDADIVIEIDEPLLESPPDRFDAAVNAITQRVINFIPDGATVQTGIGGVPGAMLAALVDKRDITVHSGIISEGFMTLARSGALAPRGPHKTGIAFGPRSLYDYLEANENIEFTAVNETHDYVRMQSAEAFISVNSALEIDLFGQANLEWKGNRLVSGIGGAPDFIKGALASKNGKSVVALKATTGKGASRIVPRLSSPTVSLPRDMADIVVTECGVAEIRGRYFDQRAEDLIAVAAPEHRASLGGAWRELRQTL